MEIEVTALKLFLFTALEKRQRLPLREASRLRLLDERPRTQVCV